MARRATNRRMHKQSQATPAIPARKKLEMSMDATRRDPDKADELQKAVLEDQIQPITVRFPSAGATEYSALND